VQLGKFDASKSFRVCFVLIVESKPVCAFKLLWGLSPQAALETDEKPLPQLPFNQLPTPAGVRSLPI
jgi:hypothetical protein